MELIKNQVVMLLSAHGIIKRFVVDDLGEIITICRLDERDAAAKDRRSPIVMGFKKSAVVEVCIDESEHTKHSGQYESVAGVKADSGGRRPR